MAKIKRINWEKLFGEDSQYHQRVLNNKKKVQPTPPTNITASTNHKKAEMLLARERINCFKEYRRDVLISFILNTQCAAKQMQDAREYKKYSPCDQSAEELIEFLENQLIDQFRVSFGIDLRNMPENEG